MKKRIMLALFTLVFISISCGIFGGSQEPTDEPTLPPPPTEEPLPPTEEPLPQTDDSTEDVVDEATPEGEVEATEDTSGYFLDEFDGDLTNWENFVVTGNPTGSYIRQVGDRIKFEIPSAETYVYLENVDVTFADVFFETIVETVSGSENGIALFCRGSDKGWYEMRVHTVGRYAGTYEAYRYDFKLKSQKKNPYVNLLQGQERINSVDIKAAYNTNTLGILCGGNQVRLFINGNEQLPLNKRTDVIRDDTLTNGTVGFGVMSFARGPVDVEFEAAAASEPE